jgi:hypothetical protein
VDVSDDPDNCGACDVVCPAGGECVAGACRCPEGEVNCGDVCADLSADGANCGGCGNFCPGECISGVCDCGALTECDVGGETVCTDTSEDPNHCGACGDGCAFDGYCRAGACECRPGMESCDPDWGPPYCADLQTSEGNCGACFVGCGFQVCSAGACVDACPAGTDACDGPGGDDLADYCTDFDTDELACGGCPGGALSNIGGAAICDADEICVGGACTRWVPAFGCDACPCDVCVEGTVCCAYPGDDTQAICLYDDACP